VGEESCALEGGVGDAATGEGAEEGLGDWGGDVCILGGEDGVRGTWVGEVLDGVAGEVDVFGGGEAGEAAAAGGGFAGAPGAAPPGRTGGLVSWILPLVLTLAVGRWNFGPRNLCTHIHR
jgi:hypothetical protein